MKPSFTKIGEDSPSDRLGTQCSPRTKSQARVAQTSVKPGARETPDLMRTRDQMRTRGWITWCFWLLFGLAAVARSEAPAGTWTRPDPERFPFVYRWSDTCHVYVLRDGDASLLIDLGDGSVLAQLGQIGVSRIDWVLFTHHHREQCQGAPLLEPWRRRGTRVAAPEAERALFESPLSFRRMRVRLNDPFTIHGSSFVRPPVDPIPLDRTFKTMDQIVWRGHEIWCVDTRGHSPGGMSYLIKHGGRWVAFSGDAMLEGGKIHAWPDSEWDYGFAAGVWALANAAGQLEGYQPAWLFPSHGNAIPEPASALAAFQQKLFRFERLLVRGYPVKTFSAAAQDPVSRPTEVHHVWRVTPHIFKFRGPEFYPNFYLIMSKDGRGLAVDCGLLATNFLDTALEGMRSKLGLKTIDAVIPTHMHGDHFLQAPHLQARWGTKLWGLDRMVAVCERPEDFDYCAPIQAYGTGVDRIRFDRTFASGERFQWGGWDFTVEWMPGQTEFALCVHGMIDGKKVIFTGDNLFGDPRDPEQTGHEAMVAHNSAILEEGYIVGAELLKRLQPDLILGGHSYVMPEPAAFIERYRDWAYKMRDAFRELIAEEDYRLGFDPFWVRAEPYRARVLPGKVVKLKLGVRNFHSRPQRHSIRVRCGEGLEALDPVLEGELQSEERRTFELEVRANSAAKPGVRLVAFDVTLDGRRYGERFDAVVEIIDPGTSGSEGHRK